MKFENVRVFNFEGALRGMRNPKNSWHLSDSTFGICHISTFCEDILPEYIYLWHPELINDNSPEAQDRYDELFDEVLNNNLIFSQDSICEYANIGPKDMKLAQTLIAGGSEHRKFMRQIFVSVDITAPLYWWKEADTYKVGTVANSTSTMHKLASKPITLDCFEIDDYDADVVERLNDPQLVSISGIIDLLETLRQKYLETNDKKYWKELVRWLPESWLQTRTMTLNYETLAAIYHQRKNHKLNEWSGKDDNRLSNFMRFINNLPYSKDLIQFAEDSKNETNS